MDGKRTKRIPLSSIFLSFFLSISISLSTPLQHQTLVLNTLLTTQTFRPAEQASAPLSDSENTLSLDLDHIDLILSSNDLNSTPQSLFVLGLQRDSKRVEALSAAHKHRGINSSVLSGVMYGSGVYFTRLGIGTPPKYVYMILDTGSDVTWLQCAPCKKCYTQADPIFDPRRSKTYSQVASGSKICRLLDSSGYGSHDNKTCPFQLVYGDGSFTKGEFLTETLTFRRNKVRRVVLGCGHDNEGLFAGAAGILGLGRGKLSFPNQSLREFGGKFSYCLVDRYSDNKSSVLFGESALSRKAVFTPLLRNPIPDLKTFYYVGLIGISIGGSRVPMQKKVFEIQPNGDGGVILDSGTTVTRLSVHAYDAVRNAFRKAFNFNLSEGFLLFDTCFNFSGMTYVKVPSVILHFTNASVSLPAENYLVNVDTGGKFCFAFANTTGMSVIGNIQQQGFRVSFDLKHKRVGFTPKSCG